MSRQLTRRSSPNGLPAAVAALLSHELNNICVPLQGFTEVAAESKNAAELRQCLGELQISVGRARTLASDLECLASFDSSLLHVAISACIPNSLDPRTSAKRYIQWECDRSTLVVADAMQAQRAIAGLVRVAAGSAPELTGRGMTVSRASAGITRCVACGVLPKWESDYIQVEARSTDRVNAKSLGQPLGSGGDCRSSDRLPLAVLTHSAHLAGGHVLISAGGGALAMVLPTA